MAGAMGNGLTATQILARWTSAFEALFVNAGQPAAISSTAPFVSAHRAMIGGDA